jgi:hypothetical protein
LIVFSYLFRTSLAGEETDLLALDEAARKMTGRRASSLGPAELAYIMEVQQGQLKTKLAVSSEPSFPPAAIACLPGLTNGDLTGEANANREAIKEGAIRGRAGHRAAGHAHR